MPTMVRSRINPAVLTFPDEADSILSLLLNNECLSLRDDSFFEYL